MARDPAENYIFAFLLDECQLFKNDATIVFETYSFSADSENVLEFPLWDMPEMLCLSHIANFEKDNTLPQFYQDQFHITRYLYSDYECIYTDGSKRGDQVACACVTPLFTDAQRIPDCSSIFSAESYAVLNAL